MRPRRPGGGFRLVVDNLYFEAAADVESGFAFDNDVLTEAVRNIYHRRFDPRTEIDARLFSEISRIINEATDSAFSGGEAETDFMRELRTNNDVFAAFKTHRMGRDMAAQLVDANGELKSFQQFRTDVQGITSHHVESWLRTEYDTAIKRSHRAMEMRKFVSEADILPNIEWLPSTAVHPREAHMPFYYHIWPIDHPFWEKHKPGDQWGCQCGWAATAEVPTDNSGLGGESIKPSPGLGGNPAQTAQLFSNDHPYFPSDCRHCSFKMVQISLFTNKIKDCYHCKNILKAILKAKTAPIVEEYKRLKADPHYKDVELDKQSSGLSAVHKDHKFDSVKGAFGIRRGDYERLAVDALRKNGHRILLASERAADGVKCPDGFLDEVVMDIKAIEGTGRWTIKGKFDAACSQQAKCVVLYFHDRTMYSEQKVRWGWNLYTIDRQKHNRIQAIEKVICVVEEEVYEFHP